MTWGFSSSSHAHGHAGGAQTVHTEVEAFWYLNLKPEQEKIYQEFHAHLEQQGKLVKGQDDKFTLLRFLKARQWDLHKAELMYENMAKWRQQHKVDELYERFTYEELEKVLDYYPHFYHNVDRFGRPVYIELLGKFDCAKILAASSMERLLDYHIWTWERFQRQLVPACTELSGKPIVTATVIVDLAGLSIFTSFTFTAQKLLKLIAHIDQDYYPESLGQMFLVNTPYVFKTIWAVVNPLLEERTRRKIFVLGSDFHELLSQSIPEESLASLFGGKSESPSAFRYSEGPWFESEHLKTSVRGWTPNDPAPKEAGSGAVAFKAQCCPPPQEAQLAPA